METLYECLKEGKDVNQTTSVVHFAESHNDAVTWLENNGGGVYRNALHRFQFRVSAKSGGLS